MICNRHYPYRWRNFLTRQRKYRALMNAITTVIILISCLLCNVSHSFIQPRAHCIHRDTTHLHLSASSILQKPIPTDPHTSTSIELDEQQLINLLGNAYAQKVLELAKYKAKHGDCLVPKRYEKNRSLGNWVNKQRQLYRKFLAGESSSMTQVSVLAHHMQLML